MRRRKTLARFVKSILLNFSIQVFSFQCLPQLLFSIFNRSTPPPYPQADAFLMSLLDVPLLSERLQGMLLMRTFNEEAGELGPQLHDILHASKTLRHNNSFHKLLEVVLLVGNYMNASNNKKGAFGFKLSFLDKLKNTKTVDNKQTLLHFIARLAEDRKARFFRRLTLASVGFGMRSFFLSLLTLPLLSPLPCAHTGSRARQPQPAAQAGCVCSARQPRQYCRVWPCCRRDPYLAWPSLLTLSVHQPPSLLAPFSFCRETGKLNADLRKVESALKKYTKLKKSPKGDRFEEVLGKFYKGAKEKVDQLLEQLEDAKKHAGEVGHCSECVWCPLFAGFAKKSANCLRAPLRCLNSTRLKRKI